MKHIPSECVLPVLGSVHSWGEYYLLPFYVCSHQRSKQLSTYLFNQCKDVPCWLIYFVHSLLPKWPNTIALSFFYLLIIMGQCGQGVQMSLILFTNYTISQPTHVAWFTQDFLSLKLLTDLEYCKLCCHKHTCTCILTFQYLPICQSP